MDRSAHFGLAPIGWLRDGSLTRCEAPYRRWLDERGYADSTARSYILCLAHFARWATEHGLTCETLAATTIDRFVDDHLPRCRCPRPVQRRRTQVRAALHQLLPALSAAGMAFAEAMPDAVERELARYDAYLLDRRGLADSTRLRRCKILDDLLRLPSGEVDHRSWQEAYRLRQFATERAERWSPASLAALAATLRSYPRYRASLGDDVAALLPVIASPAHWRLSALPQTLSTDEVERVLASFDPSLPSWRRGRAIAQCVARLGLRSAEVIGLELEDLDWDGGTIRLRRCKGRRVDVLPMPVVVGEVIVDYIRDERYRIKGNPGPTKASSFPPSTQYPSTRNGRGKGRRWRTPVLPTPILSSIDFHSPGAAGPSGRVIGSASQCLLS